MARWEYECLTCGETVYSVRASLYHCPPLEPDDTDDS